MLDEKTDKPLFVLDAHSIPILKGETRKIGNQVNLLRFALAVLLLFLGWIMSGLISHSEVDYFTLLVIIPLSLIALFLIVRRLRLYMRLERDGQILHGEIVTSQWKQQSDGAHMVIAYRFHTADWRELAGKQARRKPQKRDSEPLPPAGYPIAVYYADDSTYMLL